MHIYSNRILMTAGALLFAAATSAIAAPTSGGNPCAPLRQACMSAGFVHGGAPGKSIGKDCMRPLLLGQPVASATKMPKFDAATVSACKQARLERHEQTHGMQGQGMQGPAMQGQGPHNGQMSGQGGGDDE